MMKTVVPMSIITVVVAVSLMGQSNEMIDAFLEADRADVATSMALIAQSVDELPMDATPMEGYYWATEQSFGIYVAKMTPEDPMSLGLFYLALLKVSDMRGGFMFNLFGTPRYAANEAGYLGYVDPSMLYHTRSMRPYEVLTGITYVQEDMPVNLKTPQTEQVDNDAPQVEPRPLISDDSPPVVKIEIQPQPFSPDNDNVNDEVTIGIAVEDSSRISEWKLNVLDRRNKPFIAFFGRGRPSEQIIWDGRSERGELVESAEDYPYTFTVSDILGNIAIEQGSIAVDVLVVREGSRLKIRINNLAFQPNSSSFTLTGDEGEKNNQVLNRLAEIMKKYGSYKVIVEGHAVSLQWANPAAAKKEQESLLIPLSRSRADAIVTELTKRGISASRLMASGVGGDKPLVPHGNEEERWRNRRVEFYLEK